MPNISRQVAERFAQLEAELAAPQTAAGNSPQVPMPQSSDSIQIFLASFIETVQAKLQYQGIDPSTPEGKKIMENEVVNTLLTA